jgi:uncharacterized protein with PIN domain
MVINVGKCPHCAAVVRAVQVEPVSVNQGLQSTWHGVSYHCPHCKKIISVGIDPVALKTDTVDAILKGLGRS